MPFFHRRTGEELQQEEHTKQRLAEQQALQQASLESLARGSIPVQAQRRLDDLRGREGAFFTSDLTVNEFVLARQAGCRVLSQVMGSSVYHVGWQYTPYSYSRELDVVTRAMNHARTLALGRLREEAQRVGANAVIGVHVARAEYDWSDDMIEFNTVGTAVRIEGGPQTDQPGLTNLSGQDFWKLYQAGYWPEGVVGASSIYYVVASWGTRSAMQSWWRGQYNQELRDFTQGLYTARHLAIQRVREQASQLHASGVVGMQIEQEEEEYEVDLGNDQERTDMIFTFHILGTAISALEGHQGTPVRSAIVLQ